MSYIVFCRRNKKRFTSGRRLNTTDNMRGKWYYNSRWVLLRWKKIKIKKGQCTLECVCTCVLYERSAYWLVLQDESERRSRSRDDQAACTPASESRNPTHTQTYTTREGERKPHLTTTHLLPPGTSPASHSLSGRQHGTTWSPSGTASCPQRETPLINLPYNSPVSRTCSYSATIRRPATL